MPPLHSCWKTSATIHQKGQTLTLQMISSTNKIIINLKKKRSIIVQPQLASLAVWYGQYPSTLVNSCLISKPTIQGCHDCAR